MNLFVRRRMEWFYFGEWWMMKCWHRGKKRWVKNKTVKSTGLPKGHRLKKEKGQLIFYQHTMCSVERMERNNKWKSSYRRGLYFPISVSITAPQKPVLYVVCMYVSNICFCLCFAIHSYRLSGIKLQCWNYDFLFPFPVCVELPVNHIHLKFCWVKAFSSSSHPYLL